MAFARTIIAARVSAWRLLGAGVACVTLLALSATGAHAELLSTTFGGPGTGDGQFTAPQGIGVDQTTLNPSSGDVYVADTRNARVEQFNAAGQFLSAWGWGVTDGKSALEVCTSNCRAGITGTGVGQLGEPTSIAVDNASGPNQGDVYVSNLADDVIEEFTPSGSLLDTITGPSPGVTFQGNTGIQESGEGGIAGLAVDGEGNLWVADGPSDIIYEFSAGGALLSEFSAGSGKTTAIAADPDGGVYLVDRSGERSGKTSRWTQAGIAAGTGEVVDSNSSGVGLAVDPASGDLYVDLGTSIDQWGPSGESLGNFGSGSMAQGRQMAYNPNVTLAGAGAPGALYAVDEVQNRVVVFEPPAPAAPAVASGSETATGVAATAATLKASIDPDGLDTRYLFEYGPTTAYGTQDPLPPGADIGSSDTFVAEKVALSGLASGSTYHFRVVAVSSLGTTYGPDQTFTTLTQQAPVVEGETASVTSAKATLRAQVNPELANTSYYFEYGPTAAYGSATPFGAEIVGELQYPRYEEATISGLSANTTYHFRMVAINASGTTDGPDQTLTTATPLAPVVEGETTSSITAATAMLQASVNPGFTDTHYYFEYGSTAAYGSTFPAPPGADIGELPASAETTISGLSANTTYHYRVVAVNSLGTVYGSDMTLTTGPPLSIEGESAANVKATDADLTATIDTEDRSTRYRFEYGTTPAYGMQAPLSEATLGGATGAQLVIVPVKELQPSTTYYFRVVATNALGTITASAAKFTTYSADESFSLPDNRAYELVSPPDKNGGDVGGDGAFLRPPPAANGESSPNGSAITYASSTGFGDAHSGEIRTQYISTRGASGWTTRAITPAYTLPPGAIALDLTPYHLFTPELTEWIFTWKYPTLVPGASPEIRNLYLAEADGAYQLINDGSLVTNPTAERYEPHLIGASSNLRHVVFEAREALTPNASPRVGNVYEWAPGAPLRLVSVLPGPGEVAATEAYGAGGPQNPRPDAVSSDGSRIFWLDGGQQLYLREDGTSTVQLNLSQRTPSLGDGTAQFMGATPNGSRAFFIDETALTNAAGDNGGLYEYSFAGSRLTDLTPDASGSPGVAGVLGLGEDGASVYFVAGASLPSKSGPGGTQPTSGADNLYVAHDGAIAFIATLNAQDYADWGSRFEERTAQVTPDGDQLAFVSRASLTGYDNTDLDTGKPDAEIFLYDAAAETLRCVSCNPSGAQPIGAASLPTPPEETAYMPRYLSNDGQRVFFDSNDALLPAASNGKQNVYEYENGAIHLISSGTSDEDSTLVDASASGDDVFFATRAPLVAEDKDENSDIYDARVDGGFPVAAAPPAACSGEGCRGPVTAPPPAVAITTEESHGAEASAVQTASTTTPARKANPHGTKKRGHKAKARHSARKARRSHQSRRGRGAGRRTRAARRSLKAGGDAAAREEGAR